MSEDAPSLWMSATYDKGFEDGFNYSKSLLKTGSIITRIKLLFL